MVVADQELKIEVPASDENFAALLEESLKEEEKLQGHVVDGTVVSLSDDYALVDVGLKSEGRVPVKEFVNAEGNIELEIGDTVKVFVERFEDKNGETVLSRDKARREEAWVELEEYHNKGERVTGVIFGRVKGGFTVDLSGAVAFLPGSQVDIRPIRDISPLIGAPQPFQILKMDKQRGNIVVSRRAVLEETRAEAKSELVSNLEEGQVLQGIVKNITDYGAFIDLGGVDGLLHVTDISWKRIQHPSEVLQLGETIDVQVIRYNKETDRISLGVKQLHEDPWKVAQEKFAVNTKHKGVVTNITDYGAFIELEAGVEGLVHVTEMSWTKKNIPPSQIVSTSQEVEVVVLDIDSEKRRISLGMKQIEPNPWEVLAEKFAVGTEIEGEVRNITEFGLFIALTDDVDGMVHFSDISWEKTSEEVLKNYSVGDNVKAKVIEFDFEKERICLGIKQLTDDPTESIMKGLKKGNVVTCSIVEVQTAGLLVNVGEEGVTGFIKKVDLAKDRSEQRTDRFAVDEKVDAKITSVDKSNRKLSLSIKALEIEEEKKVMAQYGSSDSGASLGDILGAAIAKKSSKTPDSGSDEQEEVVEEKKAKTAEKKKTSSKKADAKKAEAVEDKAEEKAEEASDKQDETETKDA